MDYALPNICGANDKSLSCDLHCGNGLDTIDAQKKNGYVCLLICLVHKKNECLSYMVGK